MAAILFFDIRNFSLHRSFLASRLKAGRTTELIGDLLTDAAKMADESIEACGTASNLWMNHTGDGFILIFLTGDGVLPAFYFASAFRKVASARIKRYNQANKALLDSRRVADLGWGIGIDAGKATLFPYIGLGGAPMEGFVGSALNKASRVEAATKDHPYRVICTASSRFRLEALLPPSQRAGLHDFFARLGPHKLRGFHNPVTLFGCKPNLHRQLKTPGLFPPEQKPKRRG